MSEYAGLTLEQLEGLFSQNDLDKVDLSRLHEELLARKSRRERAGKAEKPRATQLRQRVESKLYVNSAQPTVPMAQRTTSVSRPPKSSISTQAPAVRPSSSLRLSLANNLGFEPTEEQNWSVSAFETGENLKINAFAGSGKTSTLALLSRRARGSGIYTAFNRACVRDAAGRFGPNVQCLTLHALAFRSLRGTFHTEKLTSKLNPNVVLSHFALPEFDMGGVRLSDKQLASLALATFRRFAYSRELTIRNIKIPSFGIIAHIPEEVGGVLTQYVHNIVEAIWAKMCDPNSNMPLGHDGYLKYWALTRPVLGVDFILLDEAQDTNDVVLGVLELQKGQIVYVGDRHQQIYEWRGAVNALDRAQAERECRLTKSFRFGQQIAGLANVLLQRLDEPARIVGNERVASSICVVPRPDAIVARTNGSVLSAVIACLDNGDIPYVEGGTDELKRLIRGVYELNDQGFSTVPEFFGFRTWAEVVEYSQTEYGKELATFVQLVTTHGCGRLWHVLKNVADDPALASLTISTTHKAKGREWDSVRLEDDFAQSESDEGGKPKDVSREELRILYVAITRAKKLLQIGLQTARFLSNRP